MITPVSTGGSGPLVAAVDWAADLLTGSLGTSIAILGIAGVGLGLLYGHVSARRAMTVIAGCFILFGAQSIARGLVRYSVESRVQPSLSRPVLVAVPSAPPPPPFDPYAGASVQR